MVTVPAWRKVRISGTLWLVSNGAGSWSTTSAPNGLRVRAPCAGMAMSLTATRAAAGPLRGQDDVTGDRAADGDELVGAASPTSSSTAAVRGPGTEKRRSRRLFQTTKTEDSVMAAAATSGLRKPSAASGMATTL